MQPRYLFSNLLGTFVFNEHCKKIDSIMFTDIEQYKSKETAEEKLRKKYPGAVSPEGNSLKKILGAFAEKSLFQDFLRKNIQLTKEQIRNSVREDTLIIQALVTLQDLNEAVNKLVKRLREWYGYHDPETENAIAENDRFVEAIIKFSKKELLQQRRQEEHDTMGASILESDRKAIAELADGIVALLKLKEAERKYLESMMKKTCPNLFAITGSMLGAQLITQSGSLKHLMEFPASTIQVLGAEKALFRHIKTGARPPRHGFILQHPLLATAKQDMHGKIARALADKICLAVKMDYFKGKFIGDKLLKELEKKFSTAGRGKAQESSGGKSS